MTGGGDCPGLNAVIRAIVRKAESVYGHEVIGIFDGWKGLLDDENMLLTVDACRGILPRGGTILGTSRYTPYMYDDGLERARATWDKLGLDALISIGGEGTLAVTNRMFEDGFSVVGVPKTIDNDIGGTERTFGFDTAVHIATAAIDRLHTTAESHDRVMVVEVMGRHVGHIAAWAGLAAGATITLVPEHPFDIAAVCDALTRRHRNGRFASIVVVAEGATPLPGTMAERPEEVDQFGHVKLDGTANRIASEIGQRTGFDTRVTILGHVQRGGTPTAFDRVLATRFGVAAIDAVHEGHFGQMVALKCGLIEELPLAECISSLRYVEPQVWDTAKVFFA